MLVIFHSTAFNTRSPEKHFITDRSYGSDLANWLVHQLTLHHVNTEPMLGHKDGWLVRFKFGGAMYDLVLSYMDPYWLGRLERRQGIVARLFKKEPLPVESGAMTVVHSMLEASGLVSDICWYE